MIDINPNPVDGRWYSLPEAQKRQEYLIKTMPTGTNWWWVNQDDNQVTFTTGKKRPAPKSNVGDTENE